MGQTMKSNLKIAFRLCAFLGLASSGFLQNAIAQPSRPSFDLMEATIPQLQAALSAGTIASKELVTGYLARIDAYDQRGPAMNAISVINSKAVEEAAAMDTERRAG